MYQEILGYLKNSYFYFGILPEPIHLSIKLIFEIKFCEWNLLNIYFLELSGTGLDGTVWMKILKGNENKHIMFSIISLKIVSFSPDNTGLISSKLTLFA